MTLPKASKRKNQQATYYTICNRREEILSRQARVAFDQLESTLLTKMGYAKDQAVVVNPIQLTSSDLVDVLQIGVKTI